MLSDRTDAPATETKQNNQNTTNVTDPEVECCEFSVWDMVAHDVVMHGVGSRTLYLPCASIVNVPVGVSVFCVGFGFGCMAGRRVEVGVRKNPKKKKRLGNEQ